MAPLRLAPSFAHRYLTRVKLNDSDKHSNLQCYKINNDRKRFCNIGLGVNFIKLFLSVTTIALILVPGKSFQPEYKAKS